MAGELLQYQPRGALVAVLHRDFQRDIAGAGLARFDAIEAFVAHDFDQHFVIVRRIEGAQFRAGALQRAVGVDARTCRCVVAIEERDCAGAEAILVGGADLVGVGSRPARSRR